MHRRSTPLIPILMWIVIGLSLLSIKLEYNQLQRSAFERSYTHVTAVIHNLQGLQSLYEASDGEQKLAIADLLLSDSENVSEDDLPSDLVILLRCLKQQK